MRPLLLVSASCVLLLCSCVPLPRQQDVPVPDTQPDQVLVPAGESPLPLPPPPPPPVTLPPVTTVIVAPTTIAPSTTSAPTPPTSAPPQSPPSTPSLPTSPTSPGAGGDGDDDDEDAAPTPVAGALAGGDLDGRSQRWRAGLVGGLIAGLFALIALIILVLLLALRRREPQQATGEYSAAQAGVDASGTEVVVDAATFRKDEARDLGPPVPPADGGEPLTVLPPVAATASSSDDGNGSGAALQRGPTPPPHDYVLGAGPAATRTDFIDLRTRFERDEIGDNSAVLGVDRSAPSLVEQRADAAADIAGETAEGGVPARDVGDTAVREDATAPRGTTDGDEMGDREGDTVAMTFDSQERLMAGGDGSGAVSDAPQASGPGSIAEESGDMPNLERDPMQRGGGAY